MKAFAKFECHLYNHDVYLNQLSNLDACTHTLSVDKGPDSRLYTIFIKLDGIQTFAHVHGNKFETISWNAHMTYFGEA